MTDIINSYPGLFCLKGRGLGEFVSPWSASLSHIVVSRCSGGQDAGGFRVQGQRWAKTKWTPFLVSKFCTFYYTILFMFLILYIILFYIFYYSLLFCLCPSLFVPLSFSLDTSDLLKGWVDCQKVTRWNQWETWFQWWESNRNQFRVSLPVSLQSLCSPSLSVLGDWGGAVSLKPDRILTWATTPVHGGGHCYYAPWTADFQTSKLWIER